MAMCSETEAHELERQHHVAGIANLMLAASRFDGPHCAAGLVTIAKMLAENSLMGRSAIARIMRDAARELDPDVVIAPAALQ
jgi:hypothetical protein